MAIKKRDITFDIVRSICILWIVGALHVTTYIDTSFISLSLWKILVYVTYGSLGTFTFVSGYFLKKKKMESFDDLKRFYFSRFQRFWVPFFISALSLYIIGAIVGKPWFASFFHFVLSLVGLDIFYKPMPGTLWYMVMLLFFYIITPLVLWPRNQLIRGAIPLLIFVIFLATYKAGYLDERILFYYPTYILGIFLSDDISSFIKKWKWYFLVLSLISLIVLLHSDFEGFFLQYLINIIVYPLIFSLSAVLANISHFRFIGEKVSYSSMMMYLFHRQFYLVAVFLFNLQLFPNFHNAIIPLWAAYIIVIPIIIFSSFYFQKMYDKVINSKKIK